MGTSMGASMRRDTACARATACVLHGLLLLVVLLVRRGLRLMVRAPGAARVVAVVVVVVAAVGLVVGAAGLATHLLLRLLVHVLQGLLLRRGAAVVTLLGGRGWDGQDLTAARRVRVRLRVAIARRVARVAGRAAGPRRHGLQALLRLCEWWRRRARRRARHGLLAQGRPVRTVRTVGTMGLRHVLAAHAYAAGRWLRWGLVMVVVMVVVLLVAILLRLHGPGRAPRHVALAGLRLGLRTRLAVHTVAVGHGAGHGRTRHGASHGLRVRQRAGQGVRRVWAGLVVWAGQGVWNGRMAGALALALARRRRPSAHRGRRRHARAGHAPRVTVWHGVAAVALVSLVAVGGPLGVLRRLVVVGAGVGVVAAARLLRCVLALEVRDVRHLEEKSPLDTDCIQKGRNDEYNML